MKQLSTIELQKQRMSFSSGHFAIFSATEREALHGHHYTVYIAIAAEIGDEGLNFDYRYYKKIIYDICDELDQIFLLPKESPYLEIKETNDQYQVHFHNEIIPFLKKDVLLLPIRNITIEELSRYILSRVVADKKTLAEHKAVKLTIKVFSGPGQSGSATWENA